jgi:hypothetical protein
MKKILCSSLLLLSIHTAFSQITITASDMPVSGDTLRYSNANITSSTFSIADSGTAKIWNFSSLTALNQGVDTFKSAGAVHFSYALTISPSAYGYKVSDSFPGLSSIIPVSVTNLYTFFSKKSSPSRYVAEGFAAMISGLPTPVNYSDEDEWYYFPLNYGREDSSTYALTFSIPSVASIKQKGYRKSKVDGWGTIVTPYFKTPVNCIRVRSEVNGVDTVDITVTKIGLPRRTVEYKYLVNGEHYPAVWVTSTVIGSTETVTSIRYRDSVHAGTSTTIAATSGAYFSVKSYPNPITNNILNIDIPSKWNNYQVEIFDIAGKSVFATTNQNKLNLQHLSNGKYLLRLSSGSEIGYSLIEK